MLTALIMAGGKGSRFWPLSTEEKPKQFLKLIGDKTMIQITVDRIKPIIPIDRIFVCTGEKYVDLLKEQLPELPERNIIIEPEGRNTMPCIALSAMVMNRYYNGYNMLVLPADHLIDDEIEFRNIVMSANKFISDNKEAIVTLGMKPTRAETGYGYIECSSNGEVVDGHKVIKVNSFKEKPNKEKAEEYLKDQSYLWNGGMFLWSEETILNNIRLYSPKTYSALAEIMKAKEQELQTMINEQYKHTEAISIDYGVLEKSSNIFVVPSDFGWDDIGSMQALDRFMEKDIKGNVLVGSSRCIKGENNILIAPNQNVVVNGLSGIYVIENDGHIIIGRRDEISEIGKLKV